MPVRFYRREQPDRHRVLRVVASEDAIGSLVKVMYLNDAASTFGFRPLPVSLVSSALAAVCGGGWRWR